MNQSNDPWQAGKALLIMGGVAVAGLILAPFVAGEGTTAESSDVDKSKSKEKTKTKIPKGKIVKVLIPDKPKSRKKTTVGGSTLQPTNGERKYPDFYYNLSKSSQYKFRLKQRTEEG